MEKIRIQIRVGGKYKSANGQDVVVTSRFRKRGEDVFLCSDEVARDRWGNAFIQQHITNLVADKYKFLEVIGG